MESHSGIEENIQVFLKEWVGPETARKLFNEGKGIKRDSLMNKVYEKKLPAKAVKKTPTGYRFHIPTLIGLL